MARGIFFRKLFFFFYLCAVKTYVLFLIKCMYMKKRKATLLFLQLLLSSLPLAVFAQVQSVDLMKQRATEAFAEMGMGVERPAQLTELRKLDHCSVIANSSGGCAVVSAVDGQVLGISTQTVGKTPNPGFEWWLKAVNEAVGKHRAKASDVKRPNPKRFPVEVQPLLSTRWGQLDPYNRELPYGNETEVLATGCVATAMAQVLNYYKQPVKGEGQRTVYFPYDDTDGTAITADFSSHYYEWGMMLDDYSRQSFTDEQAHAVAVLMKDCGVAADMRYNVQSKGGSGTATLYAAEGLRRYLGMPYAQNLDRKNFTDEEWMNLVFGELATGHPLVYGGVNYNGAGHSFVVHGYNRRGLVYVNWGWNGDSDGYYNIDLLNPGETSFAYYQDLLTGLCPNDTVLVDREVTLAEAGTLDGALGEEAMLLTGVKVNGPVGETDIEQLRSAVMQGRLQSIDLSDAAMDALPAKAFYGCRTLVSLKLPGGLRHIGDGALAGCHYLSEITFGDAAEDADFLLDGDIIYTKDRTEIVCVLPTAEGQLKVADGITGIHPYAFAGCVLLKKVELPATITSIHTETFRDCYWLEELRVGSKTVPQLTGYDTFDGIDMTVCTLYVPSGTKSQYNRKAQWKDFKGVVEYGTTVKARSATRKTGQENPVFSYEVMGDAITGVPELYTDATPSSPAGVYTIYVLPGTITAEHVEYVNGRLIVVQDDPSSVRSVSSSSARLSASDLQGRKVSGSPTTLTKGLYIVNGRKFIVK